MTTRRRVSWSGWTEAEDKQLLQNIGNGVDWSTDINASRGLCMERHAYLMRQTDPDYNRRPIPWATGA